MAALVGNFIVYIVRLKPLMYLYYVRYYKSAILVSRCKDKNIFSSSKFFERFFFILYKFPRFATILHLVH